MAVDSVAGSSLGYLLRTTESEGSGFEVYTRAGEFTRPPGISLRNTIEDDAVYFGRGRSGYKWVTRRGWMNPSGRYRTLRANLPNYPEVGVVEFLDLQLFQLYLDYLTIESSGNVDMSRLLDLREHPDIRDDPDLLSRLSGLLSSCAATREHRLAVSRALEIPPEYERIFLDDGVLVNDATASFTEGDLQSIADVLDILPEPVLDYVHRITIYLDDDAPGRVVLGRAGIGEVKLYHHESAGLSRWLFPDGTVSTPYSRFQRTIIHEIGHLVDRGHFDRAWFDSLHTMGRSDPDAFVAGTTRPDRLHDFVSLWEAYLTDSRKTLAYVASKRNPILSAKLAHVIAQIPHRVRTKVPFFRTDDDGLRYVAGADFARGPYEPPRADRPGDPGQIKEVNHIPFFE